MNQLNSVIIEGNACRNSEVRTASNGIAIYKMAIATHRRYKSGEGFDKEVSFFDVDCFGKTAELCGEKVRKGTKSVLSDG
jgi:single-strand DNA-binding protein